MYIIGDQKYQIILDLGDETVRAKRGWNYCPPMEVLQDEVVRRGSFNLIHQQSGIKIDMVLYNDTDYHREEFGRRVKVEILPQFEVYIAAPENIILKKLDYHREGGAEKHLIDIREIMAGTKVDESYIEAWVDRLGLRKEWEKTRS